MALLLAGPAFGQPSHLQDQEFAAQLVELKHSTVGVTQAGPFSVSPETGAVFNANITNPQLLVGTTQPIQVSGNVGVTGSVSITNPQLLIGTTEPLLVTASGGTFDTSGSTVHIGGQPIDVRVVDSTIPVTVGSLPLPAGAATEATLNTLLKAGQSIVVSTGSITAFQGGTWNIPVSVAASTETQNVNIISTFSATNPGHVKSLSVVSSLNSSTNTLLANAEFIGTAEEILSYSDVSVFVFSDVSSSSDGLKIQWSSDGTNFDESDSFTFISTGTKIFTFGAVSKYFRIRYKNGGTNQSSFRIQTILHPNRVKPSSHRIADKISGQNDAELVRSVISAKDTLTGEFENIDSKNGRLQVDSFISTSVPLNVTLVASPNRKYYAVAPAKINAAVAATDNPLLMLVNLSTNTVTANIVARTMGCDVVNVQVNYRLFLNPVVTSSGTYTKPIKVYQNVGVPESQIQAYILPTVSSPGLPIENVSQGQNTASAYIQDNQTISIAPGNRLLITADPFSNNRAQYVSIRWLEEDL